VSALLAYRNATPEVMAWGKDAQARWQAARERQQEWGRQFTAAHLPGAEPVGLYVYDSGKVAAVAWPDDAAVPPGWRRPAKERGRIVPRLSTTAGKHAAKALAALAEPDVRSEVAKLGLPALAFIGFHGYRPGIRFEDDGVWVTYGDRAVAEQVGEKAEQHGWERVPLVAFIERFGEDQL
jgi:hypothetical protein